MSGAGFSFYCMGCSSQLMHCCLQNKSPPFSLFKQRTDSDLGGFMAFKRLRLSLLFFSLCGSPSLFPKQICKLYSPLLVLKQTSYLYVEELLCVIQIPKKAEQVWVNSMRRAWAETFRFKSHSELNGTFLSSIVLLHFLCSECPSYAVFSISKIA